MALPSCEVPGTSDPAGRIVDNPRTPMDPDLEACLRGDAAAWTRFVDATAGLVRAAIRRAVGGAAERQAIDDMAQQVYLRLIRDDFRLLRTFDPGRAALATWITLVARSTAIDQVRKRRIGTAGQPPETLVAATDPPPVEAVRPLEQAFPFEILTERQRLVLSLLFERGLGVPEVANFLGVDEQTIRSTKHKALTRLRQHFHDGGDDAGPRSVPPEEGSSR